MQEYIHRLLLLKVFPFTRCCLARSPPTSKERLKTKTPSRDAAALTDGFKPDTPQRERTVSKKKKKKAVFVPTHLRKSSAFQLISGCSHCSLYYLLFELVPEYIERLVWFSGARFLPCHLKFLILCQFKRGKVPDGERKNNGLV